MNYLPMLCALAVSLFLPVFLACTDVSEDTPGAADSQAPAGGLTAREITLAKQQVGVGADTLFLTIDLPSGYKFAPDAPSEITVRSSNPAALAFAPNTDELTATTISSPLVLPYTSSSGRATLTIDGTVLFCEQGSRVCMFDRVRITAPIVVTAESNKQVIIGFEVAGPADAL